MASGIPRLVEIDAVEDTELRSAHDVAASATVVAPRVTDDHTATVEVALRNRGDRDRTQTYVARECDLNAMFGNRIGGDGRLVLAPAALDWTPASEACWRARYRNVSCGIPATRHAVTLPAGGRVGWRFDVWATPKSPCMPVGRYRFRRAFAAAATTKTDATASTDTTTSVDATAPALSLTLALSVPDA